jgi:heptosyltransferase-2
MIAPKTNFIAMYGYFNGPEVNRVLYSFHQMNHLLGYPKSENEINSSAKCSISISNVDKKVINNSNLPDDFITIVIGGEWEYRTYKKWDKVIEYVLKNNNKLNIVLIGSKNAEEDARKIWSKFPSRNIFNCIANFSFNQTAEIISKSKIVLCCDGGLMHAANSFNKTIIPLFARLEPNMQLTKCIKAFSLYDEQDVNNISVESIIEKYAEATSSFDNHLQGE